MNRPAFHHSAPIILPRLSSVEDCLWLWLRLDRAACPAPLTSRWLQPPRTSHDICGRGNVSIRKRVRLPGQRPETRLARTSAAWSALDCGKRLTAFDFALAFDFFAVMRPRRNFV